MIKKITFIRAAALSLALFSMTGCFKEDYSFCPPEEIENNVTLEFRLEDGSVFKDKVSSVTVGIFDGNGSYLKTERIEQAAINEYAGMTVTLQPGDYRMVFWANINGNTKVEGLSTSESRSAPRITYSHIDDASKGNPTTGNGDRVYYAPYGASRADAAPQEYYALTVPESDDYSDVIYFTHAHRSLEIYIKGLSQNPATLPKIEISGLPAGLKYFGMSSLISDPTKVIASQGTSLVTQDGTVYSAAAFDTFLFNDMEGINIIIRDIDGNELYSIPLVDAIEQSNADPTKIIIKLVFTFINGAVEVTIPGWKSGETGIEF